MKQQMNDLIVGTAQLLYISIMQDNMRIDSNPLKTAVDDAKLAYSLARTFVEETERQMGDR